MIVPLIGTGTKSKSAVVDAQRRVNCYLEPQRDADKTRLAVYGTPGLTQVLSAGASPFRGGMSVGVKLYVGQGNLLKEIDNSFTVTTRNSASPFTTGSSRMSFASNEDVILHCDGTNAYTWNIGTTTFAQVSSSMFANPQTVTYQDGYFLASFSESSTNAKRCQISADGSTWNALDFRGIETVPGALIRTLSFGGEVHQFGDKGIEFWAYTGDPTFPFQPIRGASLPVGLAARWSIAVGASSIYFLGRDSSQSSVRVYELVGHQARVISTPDIADAINDYSTVGDCTGYFVGLDDHGFLVLSFPVAGKTWMYDAYSSEILGTPVWTELSSDGGRHLSDLGFSLVNRSYVSDYSAGNLYLYDKSVYTDNGSAIRRQLDTRHFFSNYDSVTVDEFIADMETGVGLATGQGSDPQVMFTVSRDGGRTFDAEQWVDLGATGDYLPPVSVRSLGTAKDFVFRLAMTDPVKFVLTGMALRATVGIR